MLVEPRRNHSSSRTTAGNSTFLVVTSGKPSRRSYRVCAPKIDSVPVPVRSVRRSPCSSTWRSRSRYGLMGVVYHPGMTPTPTSISGLLERYDGVLLDVYGVLFDA